jgi:hypothetical protein
MRCGGQAVFHAAGLPLSACSEAGAVTLIHRSWPAAARQARRRASPSMTGADRPATARTAGWIPCLMARDRGANQHDCRRRDLMHGCAHPDTAAGARYARSPGRQRRPRVRSARSKRRGLARISNGRSAERAERSALRRGLGIRPELRMPRMRTDWISQSFQLRALAQARPGEAVAAGLPLWPERDSGR